MEIKTLNEQIEKLRDVLHTCYESIASKGGTLPPVGERNMTNLPDAVESVPQVVGAELEELTITENGTYTPQEGVDGFSKVVADVRPIVKVKVSSIGITSSCANEDGVWENAYLLDTSNVTSLYRLFHIKHNVLYADVSQWDTSNVTNFSGIFQYSPIKTIDLSNWNVSNGTNFQYMFYRSNISIIDTRKWKIKSGVPALNMFDNNLGIKNIINGEDINYVLSNNTTALEGIDVSVGFTHNTSIDRASLRAIINGLADLTGQTAQTLTLGATLIAKLTEEDIAIAVSKNWTIV